jgi:hypothetical protein
MPEVNTALLIALMPAILGLVNFVKALGVTGKALTIISMLIGAVMAVAAQLLPAGIFQVAYNGLIIGLAASGLYDVAAMFAARKLEPAVIEPTNPAGTQLPLIK